MWLLIASAFAADPTVVTEADGTIVLRCDIAASPEAVRAVLADPVASGELSPEVVSVLATAAGKCQMIDTEARGGLDALNWRSLRCPTATGWRYDLVSSDDIDRLHVEWRVTPAANGTTSVEYRVDTEVHIAGVPDTLVRQGTIRSAKSALARLIARVDPR